MKATDYHVFFTEFILSKTVRVSRLALLRNNKNDPCGYPNKSLFISVTDWTTHGSVSLPCRSLTSRVQVLEHTYEDFDPWGLRTAVRLCSQTDPLVYIVGSCRTIGARGAPRILKGGREMRKCSFRAAAIDMHTRGQLLLSRVELSRPLWVSVCVVA